VTHNVKVLKWQRIRDKIRKDGPAMEYWNPKSERSSAEELKQLHSLDPALSKGVSPDLKSPIMFVVSFSRSG
jgi:hypothetical protein